MAVFSDPTKFDPQLDLTALDEGLDTGGRDGRKIFVRHLKLQLALATTAGTSTDWYQARLIIVRDKAPTNGNTDPAFPPTGYPKLADFYDWQLSAQPTSETAALRLNQTQKNVFVYNENRCQILLDKTFLIPPDTGGYYGNPTFWKKRLRIMQPCYFSNPTARTGYGPGHILAYWFQSRWTTQTQDVIYSFRCRMSFTDV